MLENFSVENALEPKESYIADDKTMEKSKDVSPRSISIQLENKDEVGSQAPNYVIDSNGQIILKLDPFKLPNLSSDISIVVERKAGQINPTKDQLVAADKLVTYLSKYARHGQSSANEPMVLNDKDNLVSRSTEEQAGLLPPIEQQSLTPETREQIGNLNRFNGSRGVDMPSASSENFGSFDTRNSPRPDTESEIQAAIKEVAAGLFKPDDEAPYETVRRSPDGIVHFGRYGLSVEQIDSFFASLGDLNDPANIAKLVASGKLPKDFAEKLKDPKFLAHLREALKALNKGALSTDAMQKFLPKELQESIATDLVDRLKDKIGERPGAIAAAFLSGKSSENITMSDLGSKQALEIAEAGDKLYKLAIGRNTGKPAAAGETSDVPEDRIALISQALRLAKQDVTPENIEAVNTIVEHESGWNPRAVNNWDSNAEAGTPSQGLMQTIGPTFDSYAVPGYKRILEPLDNLAAGISYAVDRYGSLQNVPGVVKVASGEDYVGY
jgi:hypothetical protein